MSNACEELFVVHGLNSDRRQQSLDVVVLQHLVDLFNADLPRLVNVSFPEDGNEFGFDGISFRVPKS